VARLLEPVRLVDGTGAWFTTAEAGNMSHRRPHLPSRLARDRSAVAAAAGFPLNALHFMQQVHGAEVGEVGASMPQGAEIREVDALVTTEAGRALAVQVADCVPLLLASEAGPVAVAHGGRRGVEAGVVEASLDALERRGAPASSLRAAIGPAIGGCCYEVPEQLREEFSRQQPEARATTTWGTPSIDLPAAVRAILERSGVEVARDWIGCTRCDEDRRWFSHRADPGAGRQLGVVIRWADGGSAS
jgi:polyphenol oxidase